MGGAFGTALGLRSEVDAPSMSQSLVTLARSGELGSIPSTSGADTTHHAPKWARFQGMSSSGSAWRSAFGFMIMPTSSMLVWIGKGSGLGVARQRGATTETLEEGNLRGVKSGLGWGRTAFKTMGTMVLSIFASKYTFFHSG